MASKHSRIKRSISEFKNFLDYYLEEFKDAYKNIRPNQGWNIKYYASEVYDLMDATYNNLYDSLYPKLLDDNPTPDEEILNQFKSLLSYFEHSNQLFDAIIEQSEEKVLISVDSIVYDLVLKTIYKLREAIMLAEEDLNNFSTAFSDLKTGQKGKDFLIGIITATIVEHNSILSFISNYNISRYDPYDSNTYYEGYFTKDDKKVKVVLTKCHYQGMPAAATATTKLIQKYKPNVVIMLGHQAGNKNLKSTHSLGTILIGEESVDYQQNEIIQKRGGELVIEEKDRKRSIHINSWLKAQLEFFSQKQELLNTIKNLYKDNNLFNGQLKAYIGKIVSGSALLRATEKYDEIISQNPGLIGLDMETHGFYFACENTLSTDHPLFVSIKSISDYGEHINNYSELIKLPLVRQTFACYTSSYFAYEFIMNTF